MIRHIVAEGQTPVELAERYGVSLADLVRLNELDLSLPIPAGIMLWVPESPPVEFRERPPWRDVVLRVDPEVFELLRTRQEGQAGNVQLRIVRGPAGTPPELQFL